MTAALKHGAGKSAAKRGLDWVGILDQEPIPDRDSELDGQRVWEQPIGTIAGAGGRGAETKAGAATTTAVSGRAGRVMG